MLNIMLPEDSTLGLSKEFRIVFKSWANMIYDYGTAEQTREDPKPIDCNLWEVVKIKC